MTTRDIVELFIFKPIDQVEEEEHEPEVVSNLTAKLYTDELRKVCELNSKHFTVKDVEWRAKFYNKLTLLDHKYKVQKKLDFNLK